MCWQRGNGRALQVEETQGSIRTNSVVIHPTLSLVGRLYREVGGLRLYRDKLTYLVSKESCTCQCVILFLTYSTFKGIHSYNIRGWIYLLLYFLLHPTQEWWYNVPRKANIFYRIREHLVLNRISSLSILDFWEFNSGQIIEHLLNTCYIQGTTWNTRNARMEKYWSLPSRSSQSLKNTNICLNDNTMCWAVQQNHKPGHPFRSAFFKNSTSYLFFLS